MKVERFKSSSNQIIMCVCVCVPSHSSERLSGWKATYSDSVFVLDPVCFVKL